MTHTAVNIPYSTATRPVIDLRFKNKSGAFTGLSTLVDTGADNTNMNMGTVAKLGYTEADIKAMSLGTSQACGLGGCHPTYVLNLTIRVSATEEPIQIPVSVNQNKAVDEVLLGRGGLLSKYEVSVSNNYVVFRRKHDRGSVAGTAPLKGVAPVAVPAGTPGSVPPGSTELPAPTLPGGTGNIRVKFGNIILTDQHALIAIVGLGLIVGIASQS